MSWNKDKGFQKTVFEGAHPGNKVPAPTNPCIVAGALVEIIIEMLRKLQLSEIEKSGIVLIFRVSGTTSSIFGPYDIGFDSIAVEI